MGIYSRSYMRDDFPKRGGRSFDALKTILISLVVVFVLQKVLNIRFSPDPRIDILTQYLGLNLSSVAHGGIHRLITYAFLHSTAGGLPMHLLFNGLVIYFAGKALKARIGDVRLMELFIFATLVGGLGWSLAQFVLGMNQVVVGASGAAMGLMAVFALLFWNETIRLYIFIFPVQLEGKMIFYLLLGMQAFLFVANELSPATSDSTAYSAHLGGIGAGYLYYRFLLKRQTFWDWLKGDKGTSAKSPAWQQRGAAAKKKGAGRFKLNLGGKASEPASRGSSSSGGSDANLRAEVDRILDKINSKGFGSLSESEKRILDRAKDRLK